MTSGIDHTTDFVRTHDRDRYTSALFAPEGKRAALMALYAFNAELARVRDLVSEPLPGEVRLQWWRDLLEGTEHGEVSGNPIAVSLLEAIDAYDLPRQAFVGMIEARIFDLYNDPMPTLHDLEGYAGETGSALIQLASLVLTGGKDAGTAAAAGHAGVSYILMGLMRALPWHASRRQMYLPEDLLTRHNVDAERVFKGETAPELLSALKELASHTRHHLARVRAAQVELPESVRPAFLPLALVEPYLAQLEKAGHDPLRPVGELSLLRRQWILWRAAVRGKI